MATVAITSPDLERLVLALRHGPERLRAATKKALRNPLILAERRSKQTASGGVLQRRTGNLARRITHRITDDARERTGVVGALGVYQGERQLLAYAFVQEFGRGRDAIPPGRKQPIRPKRAKVLTIPLAAAKTRAGVSRGTAREIGERYESAFWQRSRRGNLIFFGVAGGRLVPLFVGVKEVHIKPARYLASAVESIVPMARESLHRELTAELIRTGGGR